MNGPISTCNRHGVGEVLVVYVPHESFSRCPVCEVLAKVMSLVGDIENQAGCWAAERGAGDASAASDAVEAARRFREIDNIACDIATAVGHYTSE